MKMLSPMFPNHLRESSESFIIKPSEQVTSAIIKEDTFKKPVIETEKKSGKYTIKVKNDAPTLTNLAMLNKAWYLYTNIATELFWNFISDKVPEAGKLEDSGLGISPLEYETILNQGAENEDENEAAKASDVSRSGLRGLYGRYMSAAGGKNPVIKMPLYGSINNIMPNTLGSNKVLDSSSELNIKLQNNVIVPISGMEKILALAVMRTLRQGRNFNSKASIDLEFNAAEYKPLLQGLFNIKSERFSMSEIYDKKEFDSMVKFINFEFRCIYPKASERLKEIKEALDRDAGNMPADGRSLVLFTNILSDISKHGKCHIYATIALPTNVGQYLTQTKDVDPMVLNNFTENLYSKITRSLEYLPVEGKKRSSKSAKSISMKILPYRDVSKIKDDTENLRDVKILNQDGLALKMDGSLAYVPDEDFTDNYVQYEREYKKTNMSNTDDTEAFDSMFANVDALDSGEKLQYAKTIQPGKIVNVDWKLARLTYVNSDGALTNLDMGGWKPVNASYEYKFFNTPFDVGNISTKTSGLLAIYNRGFSLVSAILKNGGKTIGNLITDEELKSFTVKNKDGTYESVFLNDLKSALDTDSLYKYMSVIYDKMDTIASSWTKEQIDIMFGEDIDYYTISNDIREKGFAMKYMLELPVLNPIKKAIGHISKAPFEELCINYGVLRVINAMPFIILCNKHKSMNALNKAKKEEAKGYGQKEKVKGNYKLEAFNNIDSEFTLMPNQIDAQANLANDPKYSILSIEMGGGKTLIAILDALRGIAEGERVAIIGPNGLIKNYIKDAILACRGKVNIFVINGEVWEDQGEERLETLIRSAPPNTIFVIADGIFSRGKDIRYSYNGEEIKVNRVLEFLRKFEWDRVIIDESHRIKTIGIGRNKGAAKFLATAKKVRLMSGTLVKDRISDVHGQVTAMTPGVFGSQDDFYSLIGAEIKYNKIYAMKDGAEKDVLNVINDNSNYISQRKKEWAYLLPDLKEEFHPVEMTPTQQQHYAKVLVESQKALLAQLSDEEKKKLEDKDIDDESLENMLVHFQRVDRYLTAPTEDEVWGASLKGKDRISPKVLKIIKLLDKHFSSPPKKGESRKVLVFTQYRKSAEYILEQFKELRPDYFKKSILYKAEEADETVPFFEKSEKLQIMVGGAKSLEEGYNFQFCTRIIRCETVWTPGGLSQSNGRIYRPDHSTLNSKDKKRIYIDWVVSNKSLDMLKSASLISKMVSNSKFFDDPNDVRYADLENLPIPSLGKQAFKPEGWSTNDLMPYLNAYSEYKSIEDDEMEEYNEKQMKAGIKPKKVTDKGNVKGSSVMNMPYVKNMMLPYAKELGLINIAEYGADNNIPLSKLGDNVLKGKPVHTEEGDGIIVQVKGRKMSGSGEKSVGDNIEVEFKGPPSYTQIFDKSTCFLIEKPELFKNKSVKDVLSKKIGVAYKEIEGEGLRKKGKPKLGDDSLRTIVDPSDPIEYDPDENMEATVNFFTVNHLLCLAVSGQDPDSSNEIFDELGFKKYPPYFSCKIRNYKILKAIMTKIMKAGFKGKIDSELEDSIAEFHNVSFVEGNSKLLKVEKTYTIDVRNFLLEARKRATRKKIRGERGRYKGGVMLYPVVKNSEFYLMGWLKPTHRDNITLYQKRSEINTGESKFNRHSPFIAKVYAKKADVKNDIMKLMKSDVDVSNIDEIKSLFNKIKFVKDLDGRIRDANSDEEYFPWDDGKLYDIDDNEIDVTSSTHNVDSFDRKIIVPNVLKSMR